MNRKTFFCDIDCTVSDYRRKLLDLGEKALRSVEGDRVAESYKAAFWRTMRKCAQSFPAEIWADIYMETTCHLRLNYGTILMNWLLDDEDTNLSA